MTLDDCYNLGYDISIFYIKGLWYWDIDESYRKVGGKTGFYNPNTAKLDLIEFLKNWKGFK